MKKLIFPLLITLTLISCSKVTTNDVDMLAAGEITELICEEECIVEGVILRDVILESVHLSNITFQNSNFENVTIKGSSKEPAILDKVRFIDSDITDLKIKEYVVTYNPLIDKANEYIRFNYRVETCLSIKAESYSEECWNSEVLDMSDWTDLVECDRINCTSMVEEVMSLHFKNVNGNIKIDGPAGFIGIKIIDSNFNDLEVDNLLYGGGYISLYSENSTFERFSFLNTKSSKYKSLPILSLKNTKIDYLNGLIVTYGSKPGVADPDNPFVCENAEFGKGNLLMAIDQCDDMGINFDEFSARDFEKTFLPDNSMTLLKEFTYSYWTPHLGIPKRIYFNNEFEFENKANQLYALSSGDSNYLMSYLNDLYKFILMGGSRRSILEVKPCDNEVSLLIFDWNYSSKGECKSERLSISTLENWLSLPDSFKTKIDKETEDLLRISRDRTISSTDKENFISIFVEVNHNLSGLNNCLRTRDINNVRNYLNSVKAVRVLENDPYGKSYIKRRKDRAYNVLYQKLISEVDVIKSFKSCIEHNTSIFIPQIQAAYDPIAKLILFVPEEVHAYGDERERLRVAAEKKRKEERDKLYNAYLTNRGDDSACNLLKTAEGNSYINMYFSGSSEQKKARTKNALNSCLRCEFNFWSNILNDEDFKRAVNGENVNASNSSTDMSGFGAADFKRLALCQVSGADPQIRREYQIMLSE